VTEENISVALGISDYVSWNPGFVTACLDGWFSAAELRKVADYMDANMGRGRKP